MTEMVVHTDANTPAARKLLATVRDNPEFRAQLELVLPSTVTPERFTRTFGTALLQNPKLAADATPDSIVIALLRCAADGLMPNGVEAAIASYKNKAQYLPMIGGYRKIAGEHGWAIRTVVVYENDEFYVEQGTDERIVHRPTRPGQDRGAMVAAYAIGSHADGRRIFEVMDKADIEKRKKKAQTANVWNEWPERMWEKTVGKAVFKKLPLGDDPRQARLLAVDEMEGERALQTMYAPRREAPSLPAAPAQAGSPPEPAAPAEDPEAEEQPFVEEAEDAELVTEDPPAEVVEEMAEHKAEAKEHADAAGKVVAPRTAGQGYAGKTIAAIAKEGNTDWLRWAAQPERKWHKETSENAVFGLAITAFLAHYHPDLLP